MHMILVLKIKVLDFIRLILASHICSTDSIPWVHTWGKKGPLTTTEDLSACKSTWSLIRIYTVNRSRLWSSSSSLHFFDSNSSRTVLERELLTWWISLEVSARLATSCASSATFFQVFCFYGIRWLASMTGILLIWGYLARTPLMVTRLEEVVYLCTHVFPCLSMCTSMSRSPSLSFFRSM
jgi:hypothetical protein